jgi:chromosome segregation ATPase
MNSASSEFKHYVNTVEGYLGDLESHIAKIPEGTCDFNACDGLIQETNSLLKDAGMEARMVSDKDDKKVLLALVDELKKQVIKLKEKIDSGLLRKDAGGTFASNGNKSSQHRSRMEDTNDKISRQNDTILNATRMVAETEEVGHEIINELQSNREKIISAQNKNKELNNELDDAQKRIASMEARAKCVIS